MAILHAPIHSADPIESNPSVRAVVVSASSIRLASSSNSALFPLRGQTQVAGTVITRLLSSDSELNVIEPSCELTCDLAAGGSSVGLLPRTLSFDHYRFTPPPC